MFKKPRFLTILLVVALAFSAFVVGTQYGRDIITVAADTMKPILVKIVGTSNVSLVGTSDVNVVNNSSNPVPIKDVDNTAKHSVQFGPVEILPGGTASTPDGIRIFNVTSGKQLVIETVSVQVRVNSGQLPAFSFETTTADMSSRYYIPMIPQGTFSGEDIFLGFQEMHVYADPGTLVYAFYGRNSDVNAAIFVLSFSGYLVDVQ